VQSLEKVLEKYFVLYDDKTDTFQKTRTIELDAPLSPGGHPFRVNKQGKEYFYFPTPYPAVRVPATWGAVQDLSQYEGFTCLKPGTRYDKQSPPIERDANGRLVWAWKRNTPPLDSKQLKELVDGAHAQREEVPFRLQDADTGKPILLHGGSVAWNDFRKKWVMIALQGMGDSLVGEIWYAEADQPEGPWENARKVVTHVMETGATLGTVAVKMDFYNPKHHPFFDQQGGRIVYFEGTYTHSFSGFPVATPRYEYNQVMYRLDLADPRLKM
jgi:hypothetical protein